MVDRFNFDFQYHESDPPPCSCNVKQSRRGYYVRYSDYEKLENMYHEDMRRARQQPHDLKLTDVTQKTMLHSLMNKHMSWIINLAMRLECRTVHDDMINLRAFFARRIDEQARRKI